VWLLGAVALVAVSTPAQGIVVKRGAVVLHGSTSNTTHPASIDAKKVEKETAEYKTIKADGVRKGSARYEILVAQMHERIKKACKAAADAEGNDCVVRDGDVQEANGLAIADLTEEVIDELESAGGAA
jgi:hypothetical protein